MSDCVFCDIVAGTAPASIVWQDDVAVAFLDLFPVHAGHVLVVPRVHAPDLIAGDPALAGALFARAARLAPAVMGATGAQGCNIWTASGAVAGQQVFHLHLHILPRFRDDAFGLRFPVGYPTAADRDELQEMAARIRSLVPAD